MAVIEAIATELDVDPAALDPPLYATVDLEALNRLFQRDADGTPGTTGHVRFRYRDLQVVVRADGRIVVE